MGLKRERHRSAGRHPRFQTDPRGVEARGSRAPREPRPTRPRPLNERQAKVSDGLTVNDCHRHFIVVGDYGVSHVLVVIIALL